MCDKMCQCEHAQHFEEPDVRQHDHEYGQLFTETVNVQTEYGTFQVCKHCAANHFHGSKK